MRLFAWLVQRAYPRTGRNYPQHLYFAVHAPVIAATLGIVLPVVFRRVL